MTLSVLLGLAVLVVVIAAFVFLRRGKTTEALPPPAKAPPPPPKLEAEKVRPPPAAPTPAVPTSATYVPATAAAPAAPPPAASPAPEPEKPATSIPGPVAPPTVAELVTEAEQGAPMEPEVALPYEPEVVARAPSIRPRGSLRAPATHDDRVASLKKSLGASRAGFVSRLAGLFKKSPSLSADVEAEIEEALILGDLGVRTTQSLIEKIRERVKARDVSNDDGVWEALREEALELLGPDVGPVGVAGGPTVVMVVGVNGVGKTTTIGKLASRLSQEGRSVLLAAGDTFRAAAVHQLEVWGRRVGCAVVTGKEGADPGSVIFDAITRAKNDRVDIVLADTAGRLHTKTPLMDELKKVGRTIEKALGRPADEVLLVLDATNGQNAMQQAQMFKAALPLSGLVLTKLDGTAKGGVALGIVSEHKVPIRYIGVGERVEDLRDFDSKSYVEALFTKPEPAEAAA